MEQEVNGLVLKSFQAADGSTIVEGWISSPDMDLQKEMYTPLAFADAVDDYMACGGPMSCEHKTDALPVGHMQRVAVVQDGRILKTAEHPTDAANFQHFPNSGSGLYGRARVTDGAVGFSVKSGNLRAFSWIGKPTHSEPLPGGGRRVTRVYPLLETTLTAYPVNQRATVLAAKAKVSGDSTLNARLMASNTPPASRTPDKPEMYVTSAEFQHAIDAIGKAIVEAFLGRIKSVLVQKGYAVPTLEDDPAAYLAYKAATPEGLDGDYMAQALVCELFKQVMYEGLSA
jgi:hypothetical protein